MRRALGIMFALLFVLGGCTSEDLDLSRAELRTLEQAAETGQRTFGVPAELSLAVAYTETRWQLPEAETHAGHDDRPAQVGVGALRPWLTPDPVAIAVEALGVDASEVANDAPLSLLATAAVLRHLAEARGDVPAVDDIGAWAEVLGDYAGLENDGARASYSDEVFGWIRRGVSATGPSGQQLVLHSTRVRLPDGVGAALAYGGAEYGPARWVPAHSSNQSSRSASIDRIIIHTTQGSYAGAISWFQNPAANVSAHYVIRSRDGEVTQMVREARKGWHVGSYNSRSIGIEHEGYVADPGRWYTDAMYRSSAALVRHLCAKYRIPVDRSHIIGHVEAPGATHTDPGTGWDWSRFMDLVRGVPEGPAYDASYVGQDAPAEMTSGERAIAWVEMRNDGSSTWSLDETRIGTSSPEDHASPFYDVENWMNDHRASGADHSDYATGRVGRFTFMITAPEVSEDTTVTDTFRLVQERVAWFGPEVTMQVLVHPTPASGPVDLDGDGSPADVDCDDDDASVYPGATDICEDGVDSDCDGIDPECGVGIYDGGGPVDGGSSGGGDAGADAGPPSGRETVSEGCSVGPGGHGSAWLGALFAALFVLRRRR